MEFELRAAPARRAMAVGVLYVFGGLAVHTALTQADGVLWVAALLALGAGGLAAGEALRRATRLVLRLDETGLSASDGTLLAGWQDIAGIDRGSFSLKPSNGFTLRLTRPMARGWRPGMWWRLGHRLGIGGVTPAPQTKAMAEAIESRLAQRSGA
ncbi:hypothetical protein ACR03S_02490 [Limimaricola variabilis]